jgi:hypothetical protein
MVAAAMFLASPAMLAAKSAVLADGAAILADKDAAHVPGVVCVGVVAGVLLMWAAIRWMFGKK